MSIILIVHALSTWVMVGVIWFVQLVHYPLFDRAERSDFRAFALAHQNATFWVVFPPMLTELITAIVIVIWPITEVPTVLAWIGLALVGVNATSTAFLQIPDHESLARDGFDARVHRRLVRTNWLRTAAWSVRGLLVAIMLGYAGRSLS